MVYYYKSLMSWNNEHPNVLGAALSLMTIVVVALLFYVHGKHLRSCRDGQLN